MCKSKTFVFADMVLSIVLAMFFLLSVQGQTTVNLATQGKNVDFGQFASTRPVQTGTILPATCRAGEMFFKQDAPAGQNLYGCLTANTWSPMGGLAGLSAATPADASVPRWNAATQQWEAQSILDAGTGLSMVAATVFVDDSVVPFYMAGAGAPQGACQPGRDHYVDMVGKRLYYCTGTNEWTAIATAAGQNVFTGANDFGSATMTRPVRTGTALPSQCAVGEAYYKSDEAAGQNLHFCTAANVWTRWGSGSGGTGAGVTWRSGTGVPAAGCLAGAEIYSRTDAALVYFCDGAGTWQSISTTGHSHVMGDVAGLTAELAGKAAAVHTHDAGDLASGIVNAARLGAGTASGTTFLRGDGVWATPAGGGASTTIDETVADTREEFWGGSNTTAQVGALGWGVAGTVTSLSGETGHPGIYRTASAATVNSSAYILLSGTSGQRPVPPLNASTNWEIVLVFRTGSTLAEVKYRAGLSTSNAPDQASPTTGLYLEYVNSTGCTANGTDSGWFYNRGAGAITRVAGPAVTTDQWYKVRFRSVTVGEILASVAVNGGAYSTEQAFTTSLPTSALIPFFQAVTCDTTAKKVEVDFWRFYQGGLAR